MAWTWEFWKAGAVQADETYAVTKLHQWVNGVEAAVADVEAIASWLFGELVKLEPAIQAAVGLATATGIAANPGVAAAINVTESALAALNAYQQQHAAGASTVASLSAAYTALKNSQIAYATITKPLTVSPAPAPAAS